MGDARRSQLFGPGIEDRQGTARLRGFEIGELPEEVLAHGQDWVVVSVDPLSGVDDGAGEADAVVATCAVVVAPIDPSHAITPQAIEIDYPALLDAPSPHLRAYPPETVVAEKVEAVVTLGIANSRMKDFYDLWMIARTFRFDRTVLTAALRRTFERRGTDRTGLGLGLAISRQGIQASGGTLDVRNLPGKGCVFCIHLPRPPERPRNP